MANFALGTKSMNKLMGVHSDLVAVVERAIELTTQDFMVLEGVRSEQRQRELYGQGRSAADLIAVGVGPALSNPSAKGVTRTRKSIHFVLNDGFGHAVDLYPYPIDMVAVNKGNSKCSNACRIYEGLQGYARSGSGFSVK